MTIDLVNVPPSCLGVYISNLICRLISLPKQKLYKEDNIPKYHAKIPELTLQIRAASVSRSVYLFDTPSLLDFCVHLFEYFLSLSFLYSQLSSRRLPSTPRRISNWLNRRLLTCNPCASPRRPRTKICAKDTLNMPDKLRPRSAWECTATTMTLRHSIASCYNDSMTHSIRSIG